MLTVRFADGAPQTRWSCDFDQFDFRRDPSGDGDFSGQVAPFYSSGQRVSGRCTFSSTYTAAGFDVPFP